MNKFKVGQKVRFKSHEELRQIGIISSIKVDSNFRYSGKIFTISDILYNTIEAFNKVIGYYFRLEEYNDIEKSNLPNGFWYHEDFFQSVYKLDDKFKGL